MPVMRHDAANWLYRYVMPYELRYGFRYGLEICPAQAAIGLDSISLL